MAKKPKPTTADPTRDANARPLDGEETGKPPDLNTTIAEDLSTRMAGAKTTRESRVSLWKRNVQTRLGTPLTSVYAAQLLDADLQSEINPDWSLTKTKIANLFSQVPTVRATHANTDYQAAIPPFLKQLNYEIGDKRANVGAAMEEVLADVVNAAGIGGVRVGWAARTQDVPMAVEEAFTAPSGQQIPTKGLKPEQLKQLADAKIITLKQVTNVTDTKSYVLRISPGDLLIPNEFVASNFDEADFLGHTGRMPWAEALVTLQPTTPDGGPGLQAADKDACTSEDSHGTSTRLREGPAADNSKLEVKKVVYDELFYWRYRFDPEEPNFKCIWRIVFIHGKSTPIIHEPWNGQELDPETKQYVGAVKFPIRVCAVTYISDNPVPPSDTAAGRPQVLDLRRSRLQMFQNRERSTPLRWFDVNRVDLLVQNNLLQGTHQGWIPTNGDGTRSVGEVARASYPSEDFAFDQATKQDLKELWQIGNDQLGVGDPGRKTAAETNAQAQGFATRMGQERNCVARFFLSICEVMAGLMVLYSDFSILTQAEKQTMTNAWDATTVLPDLVLNILPDSTVVLDSGARIAKLTQFLNITAKSGYVSALIPDIITELAELSGIDAAGKIAPPAPPPPEKPNLSWRFSGKEDLQNPMALAIFFKRGEPVTAQDIDAAKQLLLSAQQPAQPAAPAGGAAPVAGAPVPPSPGAGAPTATEPPAGPEGVPPGVPPQGPPAEMHKDWTLPDRIMKRSRDGQVGA